MKYIQLAAILTASLAIACTSSEEQKDSSADQASAYSLIPIDSFRIERLTRVTITDYSPEEKIFLGHLSIADTLMEISEQGEVLKSVYRKGDGPDTYGPRALLGLGFGENGERIVEPSMGWARYDQNWNLIDKSIVRGPLPVMTFAPLGRTQYYMQDDVPVYIVGPTAYISAHHIARVSMMKDTLKSLHTFKQDDKTQGSIIPYDLAGYSPESKTFYPEVMGKRFFIAGEKLYLLHEVGQEIQVYDIANDFALSEKIPVNYEDFKRLDPISIETPSEDPAMKAFNYIAGRNKSFIDLGNGFWLLEYYTGISETTFEGKLAIDESYDPKNDPENLRMLLFKDGKQLDGTLPLLSKDMLVPMGDGRLLVRRPTSTEVEEEFTDFVIYQLTSK